MPVTRNPSGHISTPVAVPDTRFTRETTISDVQELLFRLYVSGNIKG